MEKMRNRKKYIHRMRNKAIILKCISALKIPAYKNIIVIQTEEIKAHVLLKSLFKLFQL